MEKLELSTPDITQENIEKIASLFPDVVTESLDDEGNVVRAVDFDALRQDLSGAVVDGPRERYQFTWPGKQAAKLEARTPCGKTMRPVRESSVDWDTTENLYIEGDNLEALKIMRETYAGKVKLIYIDPPYNTGHDFIYDDDFAQTHADYEAESGEFDEEGGRLVANPESNGRFHSDWCSMMYPRLLLARDLLNNDGTIVISIDDNEVGDLRKLTDEIFGRACFVAQLIWKSRQNKDNRTVTGVSVDHEYLLVYSKAAQARVFRGSERDKNSYKNPDGDPKGPWASANMVGLATASARPNLHYDLIDPETGINYGCPNKGWRYDRNTMGRLIQDGVILWPDSPTGRPRRKKYLSELSGELAGFPSIVGNNVFTRTGSAAISELFGATVFDFPKPFELIEEIIDQTTVANDLIVDFFSGSASTAHAAMHLNAIDGGNRKFILVQLPEQCDEDGEAAKEGFSNICKVGEERIRRAGARIASEIIDANKQLKLGEEPRPIPDIGFRVLSIDTSNFRDTYHEPSEIDQSTIFDYVDNLVEGRSSEDLLFQVLPKFRIPYSAKYSADEIGGKTVFNVNNGQLIACFDENVDEAVIEEIAKLRPLYAVFRDASMPDDATAANFEEYFKTYSPDTIRRVI